MAHIETVALHWIVPFKVKLQRNVEKMLFSLVPVPYSNFILFSVDIDLLLTLWVDFFLSHKHLVLFLLTVYPYQKIFDLGAKACWLIVNTIFFYPVNTLYYYQGDWQSTRDHAVNTNRWLLVNIQDPKEFQCQVRDGHHNLVILVRIHTLGQIRTGLLP